MNKEEFIKLDKTEDIDFLKIAWKMTIPELTELLELYELELKKDNNSKKISSIYTRVLYQHSIRIDKFRIKLIKDIIKEKNKGIHPPDFVMNENE